MVMKRLIAGALSSAIVMMAGAAGAQDLKIALIYSKTGPLEAYADRKSTRLNSSHSQISYAVFCLKKKSSRDVRSALVQLAQNRYCRNLSPIGSSPFVSLPHHAPLRARIRRSPARHLRPRFLYRTT